MAVAHLNTKYSYDPVTQGPISTITFSLDVNLLYCTPGVSGDSVAYGLLLVQNGYYYYPLKKQDGAGYCLVQGSPSPWIHFPGDQMHPMTFSAADFYFFGQSEPAQPPPDFCETGAVIQFGYWTSNGTGGAAQGHTEHLIDNWSLTINPL
jgi:hypothetical protein